MAPPMHEMPLDFDVDYASFGVFLNITNSRVGRRRCRWCPHVAAAAVAVPLLLLPPAAAAMALPRLLLDCCCCPHVAAAAT